MKTKNKFESPLPHGFCVTPGSKCTMNYCDDNGCNDRKRVLTEQSESPLIGESQADKSLRLLDQYFATASKEDIQQVVDKVNATWGNPQPLIGERSKTNNMKTGIELIAEERQRQIEKEGWTKEHDSQHTKGELASAAVSYLMTQKFKGDSGFMWPWHKSWWKPTPDDRIRELTKAGALIAAEIDRLNHESK